ncbi:bifunctional diaminohydroxyphosphoribosylaminopyrimidine deaminase/5-amino-6-(5-phosphoribosylamino)uracil reductase RibD [Lutibacter sp. HS1-25]|uniref:bifunctional diaminohydroxyphosphoribosylaminopyrimidine deaminase/5-amino-6-(5-phosphoribosylamino)uracil reductase RibD n=1 Tax=Lutibacter sp. HS1-25 TaxID=2485000 RepID=UPI001010601F|nr:bifunctional diaminohydroxyphosphoribosylaminopyrimidine deaminase/5-amino-6-(5-phosphoribosylamino)uracil reductase RibD [Lutibacter sp. HS1-25]RXP63517.1 bifunctional diaminohydroxyphosphoribosylaminopyrimidine deaminase/5-amino-6-(5-phosphoribosylamino)uracil reductase RibD [Lutibacter sp. HS1-25]
MKLQEKYIKRCIELAKNGLGTTYPNPMVGSVIVLNDVIIGEGWHQKAGEPHAEVNAINAVKDKSLLKNATIYVSLEPCSHFGKTPPCANLIVESGIKNVVIGIVDSNSKVSGRGVELLKNNGCNVVVGVLENECYALNKRFFTFHNKKRPFVILKWAASKDGFLDKIRTVNDEISPNWISNQYSQQLVHKLRAQENAILVGTNTALADNPSLTTRSWFGNNPIRVVIDRTSKIPSNYHLFDGSVKTIVFSEVKDLISVNGNVIFEPIDFSKNVPHQICEVLYKYEIQSVIIEGGAQTLQSFIAADLWDEAYVFIGDVIFNNGLKAPKLEKTISEITKISNDNLCVYLNS